jgi:hypothetical protein
LHSIGQRNHSLPWKKTKARKQKEVALVKAVGISSFKPTPLTIRTLAHALASSEHEPKN